MSDWNAFVQTAGAKQHARFGRYYSDMPQEASALSSDALIDATHLGVISVSGPDALNFLQGQLTCDVREVSASEFRLGAWCSAKGRVQTSFWLASYEDQYLLIMDASLLESIQTALKKYILFSKASMTIRHDLVALGVTGDAATLLQTTALSIPTEGYSTSNPHGCLLGFGNRYLLLAKEAIARALWATATVKIGNNGWTLLEIRAGIPQVDVSTKDLLLPQHLNFDLINGINFKKGCYIGQEVVARLHWKGQAKNRSHRVVCASLEMNPGDQLHSVEGKALGEVIRCAINENNELELLANLRLDAVRTASEGGQNALAISEIAGVPLRLLSLPYAIPTTEASHP